MLQIARYMTSQPWTVQSDDSLAVARQMMAEREIRHLPVLDGGMLVGLLTERAVHFGLVGGPIARTAAEAMSSVHRAYVDDPLASVVSKMAEHRWDAVVVMDERDRVAGIFTAMDAVRLLADLLWRRPE